MIFEYFSMLKISWLLQELAKVCNLHKFHYDVVGRRPKTHIYKSLGRDIYSDKEII